jgi:ligand-binding SRPBCC domain-containing protein
MVVRDLRREQLVPRPIGETFAFFGDARNLERITPPWLRFKILTPGEIEMRKGAVIDYRLRLHGIPIRWTAVIDEWRPGQAFVDRQTHGPYRTWVHRHEFRAHGDATIVTDHVRYALPFGVLGRVADAVLVEPDLERIFDFRGEAVRRLLD